MLLWPTHKTFSFEHLNNWLGRTSTLFPVIAKCWRFWRYPTSTGILEMQLWLRSMYLSLGRWNKAGGRVSSLFWQIMRESRLFTRPIDGGMAVILLYHNLRHINLLRCWKLMISSMVRILLFFKSSSCKLAKLKIAWGILSKSQFWSSKSTRLVIFLRLFSTSNLVPSLCITSLVRCGESSVRLVGILLRLLLRYNVLKCLRSLSDSKPIILLCSEFKFPIRFSSLRLLNR